MSVMNEDWERLLLMYTVTDKKYQNPPVRYLLGKPAVSGGGGEVVPVPATVAGIPLEPIPQDIEVFAYKYKR